MNEHLYPIELLVRDVLDPSVPSKPNAIVELLSSRLIAAVITKDEDGALPTTKVSPQVWQDYATDAWVRYRATALKVPEFSPLIVDIRDRN